jgi:hypothetical protein
MFPSKGSGTISLMGLWDINPGRKHPIVFPHNVVLEWPQPDESEIHRYWDHLHQFGSPVSQLSPTKTPVPVWLWGDEADFRESGETVLVVAMGCCIDPRKFSAESCYPICVCRSEPYPELVYVHFCYVKFWSYMYIN